MPATRTPTAADPRVAPSDTTRSTGVRPRWMLPLRALLAIALVASAAWWVLGDQSPHRGAVLLTIVGHHGIHPRDLWAAPLLVAATALLVSRRPADHR